MSKMRIYELSRDLGVDNKEVLAEAEKLGYDVKNHMSSLEAEQILELKKAFRKPEEKQPKTSSPTKTAKKPAETKNEPKKAVADKESKPAAKKKEAAAKEPKPEPKKRSIASKDSKPVLDKPADVTKPDQAQAKSVQLYTQSYTVADLQPIVNIPAATMIKALMSLGIMVNINQRLDPDTVEILLTQLGIQHSFSPVPLGNGAGELNSQETDSERPPVVTIMGHVDHGKTSLLDAIRHANVTASEAGGITQHIGAYQVAHDSRKIVFLDTPGHEAFTAMRARGAKITDIAVLVVAADEGVMPQTIEALNHAKAAGVPIIVALNKMDKPGANPDRVKQQLSQHELTPEEWGGDTIYVEVSALGASGIDNLLDMILLVAEMSELKFSSSKLAYGTVIEAKLDKGRGPVATVLLKSGVLRVGDPIVSGTTYGKIRAMFNDKGMRVQAADATMPVEILGLSDVPPAGAILQAAVDERSARQAAERESSDQRRSNVSSKTNMSLDEVFAQMERDQVKELNLLIKSDVQGTTEALKQSLVKVSVKDIAVNIIHDGVGAITSSDVMLASASNAIIIGFNVRPDTAALRLADEEKVEIRLYRVIYEVIDDVKAALTGMLDPEYVEAVIGRAEVRNIFKFSKLGVIAGSYVLEGKFINSVSARLIRDGVVVFEGKLSSLKRFKEDVKEVNTGYECGIMLENFNDIKEGDQIEAFMMKQK